MADIPEIKNFEQIFQGRFGKSVTIENSSFRRLISQGENYGSLMLAADLILRKNETLKVVSAVVKLLPESPRIRYIFNMQQTVTKELRMYRDIIPEFINLQLEYGIPENKLLKVFPNFFGGRLNMNSSDKVDENSVIVLENLKLSGFDTGDRLLGLDLKESELVVRTLARFHALPIALRILKPQIFEQKVLPTIEKVKFGTKLMKDDVKMFLNEFKMILETNEETKPYIEKVLEVAKKSYYFELFPGQPKLPFASIVHHDFWVNNIMLLHKNDEPIDIRIVDFQLIEYGSPLRDLLFFLFDSTEDAVFESHTDDLIDLYYQSFISCLQEFNIDTSPFVRDVFDKEIEQVAPMQLGQIISMLKPICTDKDKIKKVHFTAGGELGMDVMSDKYFNKIISNTLEFIRRKWLK